MASFLSQISIALGLLSSSGFGLTLFNRDNGHHSHCPPFTNGTFNIHQFQLYPDMARYDTDTCLLYIRSALRQSPFLPISISLTSPDLYSSLFNGSIAI